MREINEQSLEAAARAIAAADANDRHPSLKRSPIDLWESGPRELYEKFAAAAITAFLSSQQELGYALVPRDPTDAMHREGMAVRQMQDNLNKAHHVIIDTSDVWRAMWDAAAPIKPSEKEG